MSQKLGENWEIVLFFLSRYQRFLDIGRVKGKKKCLEVRLICERVSH